MTETITTTNGGRAISVSAPPVVIPERSVRSLARRRAVATLVAADLVAITAAVVAVQWSIPALAFGVNVLVLLWIAEAYIPPLELTSWRYATRVLSRCALALLLPLPVWLVGGDDASDLLHLAVVTWVLVQTARAVSYALIRKLRARPAWQETAVIVGAGRVAQDLAGALAGHPEYGLRVIGALDTVAGTERLPVVGPPAMLATLIRDRGVTRVLLAFGPFRDATVVEVVRTAARLGVDVEMVPRLYDAGSSPDRPEFEQIRGIPLYRLHRAAPHALSYRAKRVFDIVGAGVLLVLAAPVMAVLAIAVRLSGPGPILFRQTRIGQHGTPFELRKFRSMHVNDDSDHTWTVAEDDRVTTVGRIMRRTSLDELPQLWNVLIGDMALVGPRPERPAFVAEFSRDVEGYGTRHRLPVGLTGLAQVQDARGDTPIRERARMDNHYIEHWSLWRDIRILLDTVRVVVNDVVSAGRR